MSRLIRIFFFLLVSYDLCAQSLTFTTLAGSPGGPGFFDGTGSAARCNFPFGVAADSSGNVYVADTDNHTIRKITTTGVVTTLAGQPGEPGSADGTGGVARFRFPQGLAADASGNLYVADTSNHTIRKISPAGVVTTLAGQALSPGSVDGAGSAARFSFPQGVLPDINGNLYVADTFNHTIRQITPDGAVTTFAGQPGSPGSTNGTESAARFRFPVGIAADSSGNLYVADRVNHTIRMITPAGAVTTLAGQAGSRGSANGTGSAARFNNPAGLTTDSSGNIHVADLSNHTIRKVTAAGVVTTLAGQPGVPGSADGTGSAALFHFPFGVAADSSGNIYAADKDNHTIRRITFAGVVTTLAGQPAESGSADPTGSAARFNFPQGVAADNSGTLYVADRQNHTIRKITPEGLVTTLAGQPGSFGNTDGTGSAARFEAPRGVSADSSGNIYVADTFNHTIRKITPTGLVTTLAGQPGSFGNADGTGSTARFDAPSAVTVDSSGNLYVADTGNHTIRKITPGGMVTTLAGQPNSPGNADGTGSAARFNLPFGIAVDNSGILYVADKENHIIRKITPEGMVTTLAGQGGSIGSADGTGSAARFNAPFGVSSDSGGTLYVADTGNHTIRKITPSGDVTTLAGQPGSFGSADGAGTASRFNFPYGVAADSSGTIAVADTYNHTIRKISTAGTVTTVAGQPGSLGNSDATGGAARFRVPRGVAPDNGGNLYIADTDNHTIRKIAPDGAVTTHVGQPGSPGSADGTGSAARFRFPRGVAVDSSGNLYVVDTDNHTIRKITSDGMVTTFAGQLGSPGSADGTGGAARFKLPIGIATDISGNLYIADTDNHTIRKITPDGMVTTVAGQPGLSGSTDGTGSVARFNVPRGIAVDSGGNIYVADTFNQTIRKITHGMVTTLAGQPDSAGSADGIGSAARFNFPYSVATDSSGNLYVVDTVNHTIRKITPDGVVTTLAGQAGSSGSADGTGDAARFNVPRGIATGASGKLYIADSFNHSIRKGEPALPDMAVIDRNFGAVGQLRQLNTSPNTATSWSWRIVRRPSSSTAQLSSASIRNPTFVPDVADSFIFQLTATNGVQTSITMVELTAVGLAAIPLRGWVSQSNPVAGRVFYDVHAVDANTAFAVGSGGTIIKTIDAGQTWTQLNSGTTVTLSTVYFLDANTGFAAGGSTILKTTDGGSNWISQNVSAGIEGISFATTSVGVAVGSVGSQGFLRTTDGGQNWAEVNVQNSGTNRPQDLFLLNAQQGWTVGLNADQITTTCDPFGDCFTNYVNPKSRIWSTTDAGATWTTRTLGMSSWLRGVSFVDTASGWIVGDGGLVLKTTDGGITWSTRTSGAGATLYGIDFVDGATGWTVGNGGVVLRTTDGGETWTTQDSGTSSRLYAVDFVDTTTGWAVGDNVILRTERGGTPPPTISAINPTSGSTDGGTSVTISGTNFSGASVSFGAVPATNVNASSTSITATTPASAAGNVHVTVTNPDGRSATLVNGYTFVAPPMISSISPTSGSTAGGTAVTITGTNFMTGATVRFGAIPPTGVTVVNATSITTTTGAHSAGTVDVVVTVNGVSGTLTNGFTYILVAGDIDGDGAIRVMDVVYLLNYLFGGGPSPIGPPDVNADGQVNINDVFYLINHIFSGGPAPL